MHVVKSVGVLSVAKIVGMLYACMGLLVMPVVLLVAFVGTLAGGQRNPIAGVVGIVLALFLPVFYGVLGFVMSAIGCLLYNLFAHWMGGFEVEVELKGPGAMV